jgi:crossover junction endodeoxyribonuclease RusA
MTEAAFQSAVSNGAFDGMHMPPRVVTLPWPSKTLSPNARAHWRQKASATKVAREAAHWLTWQQVGRNMNWRGARLSFTFNPPDKRRRDTDNCIASTKAARDGIADALGIDDSKFECSYRMGEPVKGGAVRIEIRPI